MGRIIELCEAIRAVLLFATHFLLPPLLSPTTKTNKQTKKQNRRVKNLLHVTSSHLFTSLSVAAVLKRFALPVPYCSSSLGWALLNPDHFPKPIHYKGSTVVITACPKTQQSMTDLFSWECLMQGCSESTSAWDTSIP